MERKKIFRRDVYELNFIFIIYEKIHLNYFQDDKISLIYNSKI